MKNAFEVALESYINTHGSISDDAFKSLADIFVENSTGTATSSNSIKKQLIAELTEAYKELKNCPGISDKITVDDVKTTRKQVQSAITTFRAVLQKFVKMYNKVLKDGKVLSESAADDANKEVRKLLALSDAKAKSIKSDKSMDKVSKAKALKDVIKAKASGVKVALTALDHTFNEFISAVKKDDDNIKEEYKILDMQLKLFTQQYEALTGYVIDNAPFIAAVGLTICVSTAAVTLGTSHMANAAIASASYTNSALDRMAAMPSLKGIDVVPIDVQGVDVSPIITKVDELASATINDAWKNGIAAQMDLSNEATLNALLKKCSSYDPFTDSYKELINIAKKSNNQVQEKIVKNLVKMNLIGSASAGLGISAGAALLHKAMLSVKKRKGYNKLSFVHKEDILSKATNNASMKKKEKILEKMRQKVADKKS